jgi:hypothetical protein
VIYKKHPAKHVCSVRHTSVIRRSTPGALAPGEFCLRNHMTDIVAVDMFLVATATFKLLYTLIFLDHHRRRVIYFDVTRNPTQMWLTRQITEAFR